MRRLTSAIYKFNPTLVHLTQTGRVAPMHRNIYGGGCSVVSSTYRIESNVHTSRVLSSSTYSKTHIVVWFRRIVHKQMSSQHCHAGVLYTKRHLVVSLRRDEIKHKYTPAVSLRRTGSYTKTHPVVWLQRIVLKHVSHPVVSLRIAGTNTKAYRVVLNRHYILTYKSIPVISIRSALTYPGMPIRLNVLTRKSTAVGRS